MKVPLRLFAFCREKLNNLVKDDDGIIFFVMGEYNAVFLFNTVSLN